MSVDSVPNSGQLRAGRSSLKVSWFVFAPFLLGAVLLSLPTRSVLWAPTTLSFLIASVLFFVVGGHNFLARFRGTGVFLLILLWGVGGLLEAVAVPEWTTGMKEITKVGFASIGTLFFVVWAGWSEKHWQRAFAVVLGFLVVSVFWFVCELFIQEPFRSLRYHLFAAGEQLVAGGPRTAHGLTGFLHIFGYHLSALGPILVALMGYSRRRWVRLASVPAILCILALANYSSQRSAVLAIVLGSMVVLFIRWGSLRARLVLSLGVGGIVIAVIAMGLPGVVRAVPFQRLASENRSTALERTAEKDDGRNQLRFSLQTRAARMLLEYPEGTILGGISWEEEGWERVRSEGYRIAGGKTPAAPHNGYLTRSVRYGLLYFLVALCWLGIQLRNIRRAINIHRGIEINAVAGLAGAVVATLFVQAMFHNACVYTRESVSVALVVLLITSSVRPRNA